MPHKKPEHRSNKDDERERIGKIKQLNDDSPGGGRGNPHSYFERSKVDKSTSLNSDQPDSKPTPHKPS